MNQVTVDIAARVASQYGPCSLEMAREIQTHVEVEQGLDLSECTRKEFNTAIAEGYTALCQGWVS